MRANTWLNLNRRKGWILFLLFCIGSSVGLRAADRNEQMESARRQAASTGPISIDLVSTRLETALDFISRASGVNVKVKARDREAEESLLNTLVTVRLKNVTPRTAIQYIATKYNFIVNTEFEAQGIVYLERPPRVTMDVENANIVNVIKLIAKQGGVNVMISPGVQGRATFNIQDVPWKDALESVLKSQNFVMVEEPSGILRITTPEQVQQQMEIRAVQLRYVQPEGAHFGSELSDSVSSIISRLSSTEQATVESSLLAVLNRVKSPDGSVTYESRTNTLILKDTAKVIEEMISLIRQIDKAPRQVKIQCRLLTQRMTPNQSTFGVNWGSGILAHATGGIFNQTTDTYSTSYTNNRSGSSTINDTYTSDGSTAVTGYQNGVATTATPWTRNWSRNRTTNRTDLNQALNYARNLALSSTVSKPFDYGLGGLNGQQLTATLQIAANSGNLDIVQAPEILTLDHQEATVFIGTTYEYAVASGMTTDGGTTQNIEVRTAFEGVQLMVVPHICGDTNQLVLEVIPTEQERPVFDDYDTGNGTQIDLPTYTQKTAHTRMLLESGETGVIAGLYKHVTSDTITKIPVLGDIPIIKYAFSQNTKTDTRDNTIILVTPHIIGSKHSDDFMEELESVRDMVASEGLVDGEAGMMLD